VRGTDRGTDRWLGGGLSRGAFSAALALVLYWPVLLGRAPFPADVVLNQPPWSTTRGQGMLPVRHAEMADPPTQMYPWRKFAAEAVRMRELPLWNPHVLLGFPAVANLQGALLYPPNGLYYVLPPPLAWSLTFMLRTALACWFVILLSRRLGASDVGALVAGVGYACSGFMVAWEGWPHVDAALWIPATMLAVDRLLRRRDGGALALTAAAFAMPVLGGHPNLALHAAGAAVSYGGFRLAVPRPDAPTGSRLLLLPTLALAGLLAIGLSAVQILPTLEWIEHLVRPAANSIWEPPRPIAYLGFWSRDVSSNPDGVGLEVPVDTRYAGILAVLTTPLAFVGGGMPTAVFLAALVLVGSQLRYGSALMGLGLALLGALGTTAAVERKALRSTTAWLAVSALASAAALAALGLRCRGADAGAFFSRNGLLSSAVLLTLELSAMCALHRGVPVRRAAAVLVALNTLDLVSYAYRHMPVYPRTSIFPEPKVYEYLRGVAASNHRILSIDDTFPSNTESVFGFDSPAGNDYIMRSTARWLRPFTGDAVDNYMCGTVRGRLLAALPDRRIDLMGVRYVIATTENDGAEWLSTRPDRYRLAWRGASVRVYENMRALPRMFLVGAEGVEVHTDEERLWERVAAPEFDPECRVLLDRQPAWRAVAALSPDAPAPCPEVGAGRVLSRAGGFDWSLVLVEAVRPAVLVWSDLHYPGWRVEVDGRPAILMRADAAFRGVALEPGQHEVRFVYAPTSFRVGAGLTAISLVACIALVAGDRRRCRASRR
jgi:hypothetical protein